MDKSAHAFNVFALKFSKRTVRIDVAKYSFSTTVVKEQNILGDGIIESNSLSCPIEILCFCFLPLISSI